MSEDLEKLIETTKAKIAEREEKQRSREKSQLLFALEFPPRYVSDIGQRYEGDSMNERQTDEFYIKEIDKVRATEYACPEDALKSYESLFNGLKRVARRRMNIVDAVLCASSMISRDHLSLYKYSPEVYIKGLETMEYLAKKYKIESFERDMELFSRLTARRLSKGCDEAIPIAEWLKERNQD